MDLSKITEWSYKRYGLFFKNKIKRDKDFDDKINKIIELINNEKILNIDEIAEKSNCTLEECFLKINYLKNKKILSDKYYIDRVNKELKECNEEEKKLLEKYNNFLYLRHFQIDQIVLNLQNTTIENKDEMKEKVLNELLFLENKGLLNGITINLVDKKIIYYSLEKHKKELDYLTIECENCGALNDVNIGSKTRCEYCETIIDGTNEELINYVKNKKDTNQ